MAQWAAFADLPLTAIRVSVHWPCHAGAARPEKALIARTSPGVNQMTESSAPNDDGRRLTDSELKSQKKADKKAAKQASKDQANRERQMGARRRK
jgi:hypothetical protein